MPYFTKGKCIYKKATGKKVGCTEGSVKQYLAALHANVNESVEYKDVVIPDGKTEASVYYTLTDDPLTEIALVFKLFKGDNNKIEADYDFCLIKDSRGGMKRFQDPLKAKRLLSQYGIKPDDIERIGQESYEIIEDELNYLSSTDNVVPESLAFDKLYNNLIKS